jgi:hypothetical protein
MPLLLVEQAGEQDRRRAVGRKHCRQGCRADAAATFVQLRLPWLKVVLPPASGEEDVHAVQ